MMCRIFLMSVVLAAGVASAALAGVKVEALPAPQVACVPQQVQVAVAAPQTVCATVVPQTVCVQTQAVALTATPVVTQTRIPLLDRMRMVREYRRSVRAARINHVGYTLTPAVATSAAVVAQGCCQGIEE